MIRLSRGCYDKFHRCPGWVGGGPRWPKGPSRCSDGRIQVDYDAVLWRWRFWPCNRCNVVVWPYVTRWLSPWQWAGELRRRMADEAYLIRYEWREAHLSGNGWRGSLLWLAGAQWERLPRWWRMRRMSVLLWRERQAKRWRRLKVRAQLR